LGKAPTVKTTEIIWQDVKMNCCKNDSLPSTTCL